MPFIGRWKLGHGFNIALTFALLIGAGYLTTLAINEDAANKSYQAAVHSAEFEGHRAVELAKEYGIPPQGALTLLKDDALIQGPKLFKRNCSSCHRYNGHDGLSGVPSKEVEKDGKKVIIEEPATATDLGQFGSRVWITHVLTDYQGTFASLDHADEKAKRILTGEMAGWSKDNAEALKKSENAEALKSLVEFVVAQSGRKDLEPFDANLVTAGQEIFKSGKFAGGALTTACADCHALKPAGGDSLGDGAGPGYPTLTGYAGKEWLKSFINNPGHDSFYGADHNAMPPFEGKMSDKELGHLVDWMTGDYFPTSKTKH